MKRFSVSLRTRIILTYLAIFLVSAAVITGLAGWFYSQSALQNAYNSLEAQAFVAASALERPMVFIEGQDRYLSVPDLEILAQRFTQAASSQISVVDSHGAVVASSLTEIPDDQSTAPEIVTALAGQLGHDLRWNPLTRQPTIYAAAPVRRLGRPLFAVQISLPLSAVTRQERQFWLSLGLTVLLAALAAALAGWGLAATVARPVDRLRNAATRLAAGALDERVPEEESGGVVEVSQLAAAFNNMAERIQEMMDRQRAFVANASHELRTPITNIKLRAEALGNGALEDAAVAPRFVGEIESEADRLGRLAGDLLTLSRQDAAPAQVREPVDLGALAREVIAGMTLRAQKSGINLEADLPGDLPSISADSDGLRTVLVNLLDNAMQHTPAGGRVTVRMGSQDESLRLAVADTGAGIPADDLPHIFERFYRVDKARSRRTAAASSGAGLGLAIVQGIVSAHGGTVAAESVVGQGTTITVSLPLQ